MKIVVAVHHFPPNYTGGAEWRAYRMAAALQARGHEVHVVCVERIDASSDDGVAWEDDVYDRIVVRRLSFNLAAAPDPFRWEYDNPWIGHHLREFLGEQRPDVFHLIGGYLMSGRALQVAHQLGMPTVVTLTDFWFLCPRITLVRSDGSLCSSPADPLACALCLREEQRRYRLPDQLTGGWAGKMLSFLWQKSNDELVRALGERKAYLLSLLNTVNAVISPSLFLKEMFECLGVSPQRFLYMRQGLDVDNWVNAEPVASDSQLRIGYIGQIAHHKGVDVLVDAFCRLHGEERKPQLLLYGDPQQFSDFTKRLWRQVNGQDNVIFAGRFDHSQIGRVLAELDVLVVPSVWYENSPNVILEAFATGTPVVVSRLGGMAELVTDGVNGFQFETGDVEALAHVLQRFIDQPDLSTSLLRGIPPVKTVQEEIKELLQLYATLEVK